MKIDRQSLVGVQRPDGTQPSRLQPPTPAIPPVTVADGVALSGKAKEAYAMRIRLKKAPEIRADLVARIKAQVEAGHYNAEPRAVAESILRTGVFDE